MHESLRRIEKLQEQSCLYANVARLYSRGIGAASQAFIVMGGVSDGEFSALPMKMRNALLTVGNRPKPFVPFFWSRMGITCPCPSFTESPGAKGLATLVS